MTTIRPATPADAAAIFAVEAAAFPTDAEARLVQALDADGDTLLSLVAEDGDALVGHILFSRMGIVGAAGEVPAVALAPVAVPPVRQGQGVGRALIETGLALCRDRGEAIVLVLGDPAYYGRFGFRAEAARAIESPWPGPHFMALTLRAGGLDGVSGCVRYAAAFAALA